jgi:pilus assembly protein CpaC
MTPHAQQDQSDATAARRSGASPMMRLARALICLVCVVLASNAARAMDGYDTFSKRGEIGPSSSLGRAAAPDRDTLNLKVSRGQTIRLSRPATSIFVADPAVADIQTPSSDTVFIFGKKAGRTSLFALGEGGRAILEYQVIVTQPIEDLRELLRAELGGYNIQATYTPNGAVISGTVPNAAIAENARGLVSQFLGQGAIVSNRLKVVGGLQVNLQVRVAEVSRDVAKEFGFNINASTGTAGGFSFGLVNGRPRATGTSGGGQASFGFNVAGTSVSAVLDALAQEGLVSILAEPNLTAVSGESANFLAGGEFPIPVNQGLDRISVEFKKFGVALSFTPTVLSGDLISVRVQPEVSDISSRGAVAINGFNIPAISTRRADTTVELASGQSFAIGGLIRKGFNTDISAFPFLGDLPILGTLFRSSSFQRNETELVIIVTPYLVRPAAGPQALRVPTDRIAPSTDAGRVLFNKVARPPVGRAAPVAPVPRLLNEPAFLVD